MIFREKLVNASTGEVRQGNVLDSSLGEVEQIMIDSSLCSVMYYWVKTPDSTWRKTQYYELVENLYSIIYKVNDSIYQTYYLQEGDDVPVPDYTPATGYTWSGWLNENIPDKMPASDIVVESYTEQTDYAIIYYIDGRVVYSETHHYNDSITAYVPETREHYVFSGWSGFPQSGYMPAENVTVTGTYEEDLSYVLSYYIDSSVYTQQSYMSNDVVDAPDDPQVEEGYSWSGWIDLPSLMPAYDSSVHSVLTANQYILDYYVDSSLWNSLIYNYKQSIVPLTYTPAEGYIFSGWVNEPETMPAINHYRVDGMTQLISVLYNVYWYIDSSLIQTAQYESGTTVTSPVCEDSAYEYDWNGYDTFVMPSADTSIYGEKIAKTEPVITYTVSWYIGSSLIQTGEYAPGTTVTSPVCQDPDYVYDWDGYDTFTMPHNYFTIYGEKIAKTEPVITYTVSWFIDSSLIQTAQYAPGTTVTSPLCQDPDYVYNWNGYDTFTMASADTSIYGEKIAKTEPIDPIDPSIYIDSSLFGVSLMQYGTNISHPTVDFGYIVNVNHNFSSATADGISAKLYINKPKTIPTNRVMEEIGDYIIAKFKYLISTDGVNWTDAVNAELNTDISDKRVENNIVYLPELSSYVYVRLALKSINTQSLTLDLITNGTHYSIIFANYPYNYYPNPSGLIYDIRSIFALNNNQKNSEYQVFGDFEGFYSHLVDELNSIFNCQMQMHGLILTISNKICHAHRAYEHTAHNYITSGLRYWNGEEYSLDSNTCTIKTAPVILATDIYWYCYWYRWESCTSLTSHCNLPATTLAYGCYRAMFAYCSSLTSAPTLPATTLAPRCYQEMFYGCASLTTAPTLPATTLIMCCYQDMFNGCTSLTTAPELPATTLVGNCYSYMFGNCTSLTTAPELPATTLDHECYRGMFRGCSSLVYIPSELPALTVSHGAYEYMFSYCTSLEESLIISGTSYGKEACEGMFYNCTNLLHRALLPAVYDAVTGPQDSFGDMYTGCTSLQD